MQRRAFFLSLASGLAAPHAFAQSRDYSRMRASELMRLAQREQDRLRGLGLSGAAAIDAILDVAEIWIAAYDAQGREGDFTMAPLFDAATHLLFTPELAEAEMIAAAPAGDAQMHRLRTVADAIRSRAEAAVGAYPRASTSLAFRDWLSAMRGLSARATILAAAWLRDTRGVQEAIAAAEQRLEPISGWYVAHAVAIGHSMLGNDAEAYEQARRAANWARQGFDQSARGRSPRELADALGDSNITAAFMAARVEQWRAAWNHLIFGRTLQEDLETVRRLEQRLWANFEGVATLVLDYTGAQLWFASRQGGFERTARLDLPGLRRIDVQRFMVQMSPAGAANGVNLPSSQWGWYLTTMGEEDPGEFHRRVTNITANAPQGFAEPFARIIATARDAGVQRLAWMPSPSFALFPVAGIGVNGASAADQVAIATIASPRQLERGRDAASSQVARATAFTISGGDEDIPLARMERLTVSVMARSSGNQGGVALHIASHASAAGGRMRFQSGPNAWMTVTELSRSHLWQPTPRLVVMSACDSLLDLDTVVDSVFENNVGVHSPAQELIEAGAGAVIGAVWKVTDLTAFMFSTQLYLGMIEQSLSPLAAFQAAVSWLRRATVEEAIAHVESLSPHYLPAADADEVLGRLIDSQSERPFGDAFHWAAWMYWGT